MYQEIGDLRPQFSHNVLSWQPYFQALLHRLFTTCADLCATDSNTEWGSSTQNPIIKGNCNILFELQKNNPDHHTLVGTAPLLLICHAKCATKFLIFLCLTSQHQLYITFAWSTPTLLEVWKGKSSPTPVFWKHMQKLKKNQLLYHRQTESMLYCIYEQKK